MSIFVDYTSWYRVNILPVPVQYVRTRQRRQLNTRSTCYECEHADSTQLCELRARHANCFMRIITTAATTTTNGVAGAHILKTYVPVGSSG